MRMPDVYHSRIESKHDALATLGLQASECLGLGPNERGDHRPTRYWLLQGRSCARRDYDRGDACDQHSIAERERRDLASDGTKLRTSSQIPAPTARRSRTRATFLHMRFVASVVLSRMTMKRPRRPSAIDPDQRPHFANAKLLSEVRTNRRMRGSRWRRKSMED